MMKLFLLSFQLPRFAFLAVDILQALGGVAGIINAIALVAMFGGLVGAIINSMGEKNISGVKISLVISALGGLAWVIVTAFFTAGGQQANVNMQAVN